MEPASVAVAGVGARPILLPPGHDPVGAIGRRGLRRRASRRPSTGATSPRAVARRALERAVERARGGPMSRERHDRRRTPADRRARQGRTARPASPPTAMSTGSCTHGSSSRPRRTRGSAASTAPRHSTFPASSPFSSRATSQWPDDRHRPDRRSRSHARRWSSPASRSRSSSPRRRPRPRTASRRCSSSTSRSRRSSTSRRPCSPAPRSPGSSRSRRTEAISSRSTRASTRSGGRGAGTALGQRARHEFTGSVRRCAGTASTRATPSSRGRSGHRGSTRRTWSRRSPRPGKSPDGTLVVSTSTQGSFVTQRELARAFGLPLERIRVVAEPLGGAFGGKFALVEPLAVGAALALARPVRLALSRGEDFQATNPASAQVSELADRCAHRRDAHRDRGADDRRSRLERRLGCRRDHLAPRRRAVHLGGARPPRLRRPDEPLHLRRLPRPGCADRRVRDRVAARRARSGARPRPDRAAAEETPSSRATWA